MIQEDDPNENNGGRRGMNDGEEAFEGSDRAEACSGNDWDRNGNGRAIELACFCETKV